MLILVSTALFILQADNKYGRTAALLFLVWVVIIYFTGEETSRKREDRQNLLQLYAIFAGLLVVIFGEQELGRDLDWSDWKERNKLFLIHSVTYNVQRFLLLISSQFP